MMTVGASSWGRSVIYGRKMGEKIKNQGYKKAAISEKIVIIRSSNHYERGIHAIRKRRWRTRDHFRIETA